MSYRQLYAVAGTACHGTSELGRGLQPWVRVAAPPTPWFQPLRPEQRNQLSCTPDSYSMELWNNKCAFYCCCPVGGDLCGRMQWWFRGWPLGLGSETGCKYQLCHLLAVWLWGNCLFFSSLIWKAERSKVPRRLVVKTISVSAWKVLRICLAQSKCL